MWSRLSQYLTAYANVSKHPRHAAVCRFTSGTSRHQSSPETVRVKLAGPSTDRVGLVHGLGDARRPYVSSVYTPTSTLPSVKWTPPLTIPPGGSWTWGVAVADWVGTFVGLAFLVGLALYFLRSLIRRRLDDR